jgi:hypothetical protein
MAAMLPECEPPSTTLGAPTSTDSPASREAWAASAVVGNSAMVMPFCTASRTCSCVASSWLAIGSARAWARATISLR